MAMRACVPGRDLCQTRQLQSVLVGTLMLVFGAESSSNEGDFKLRRSSSYLDAAAPVKIALVQAQSINPIDKAIRGRIIPAHTDVGLRTLAKNGCIAELSIVPGKTRLSRFELDPVMSVDVMIYRAERRVGLLSTKLTYKP